MSETTPTGTVGYQYDTAGRRAQLTVTGQTNPVTYAYDAADRLTGITQGSSGVTLGYDNAGRRTTLTLPNGVQVAYGFDNANQLTSLTYTVGSTTVGTLTYAYDGRGRIATRGGTLDATNLPTTAVTTTTYNAGNRLTQWGSSALSYDLNGNLTSDGSSTYTWNARDQLTSISGAHPQASVYDGTGRRQSVTVSGVNRTLVYDGPNLIQELNGGATVNYLTGSNIDETYSATTSSGTQSYLTDILGSSIALTDNTGAIKTNYVYEPYGNATTTGAASTNALQYTGRDNDGTGVYYNRARYYSPQWGRFISEDPIGLAGGVNTYAYAGGNPVSYRDPLGLFITSVDAACMMDPSFCAEIMGQIVQNAAALSPNACMQDAADAVSGAFNTVGTLAAILPVVGFAARTAEEGGLVIGKMPDLAKPSGWREGDYTLNLPKLPEGPGQWAQNERELQNAINLGRPIRDISPTQAGGFLDRERDLLIQNGWKFDSATSLWSPGR
jgi:RHS repeat-associated protein